MKTQTAQHTPTPYRIGDAGHTIFGPRIDPYPYESVAPTMVAQNLRKVDAAFIVRAVNCHEELMDALRVVLQTLELGPRSIAASNTIPFIKEAIAKAEGKNESHEYSAS